MSGYLDKQVQAINDEIRLLNDQLDEKDEQIERLTRELESSRDANMDAMLSIAYGMLALDEARRERDEARALLREVQLHVPAYPALWKLIEDGLAGSTPTPTDQGVRLDPEKWNPEHT